jgi:hypothetical protein
VAEDDRDREIEYAFDTDEPVLESPRRIQSQARIGPTRGKRLTSSVRIASKPGSAGSFTVAGAAMSSRIRFPHDQTSSPVACRL